MLRKCKVQVMDAALSPLHERVESREENYLQFITFIDAEALKLQRLVVMLHDPVSNGILCH